MLIEEKIQNAKLSPSEKEIIQYIIKNKYQLKDLTTRQIGKETFTSPAAIIRLSHKLGFNGFNDLKQQYLQEIEYMMSHFNQIDPNIPFNQFHSIQEISYIMEELMIETSKDTLSLIDHDTLRNALNLFKKSKHIYIFGFGAYVNIASSFQMKMTRIHKPVFVYQQVGEMKQNASIIDKNDCAIFISYSGENETLLFIAHYLKERNIPIIVLTSLGDNSMSHLANHVFRISTREKLFSKIANFSTEYSVELIFNILFSCYFSLDYEKNLEYKISNAKQLETNRFSNYDDLNK